MLGNNLNKFDCFMIFVLIVSLSVLFFQSCELIYPKVVLKPDNLAEELLEDFIDDECDIDLDLTPLSPETR